MTLKQALVLCKDEYRKLIRSGVHDLVKRERIVYSVLNNNADLINGYDVLSFVNKYTGRCVYCINVGETYERTIMVYVGADRAHFKIGNWGDLIETGKYE